MRHTVISMMLTTMSVVKQTANRIVMSASGVFFEFLSVSDSPSKETLLGNKEWEDCRVVKATTGTTAGDDRGSGIGLSTPELDGL